MNEPDLKEFLKTVSDTIFGLSSSLEVFAKHEKNLPNQFGYYEQMLYAERLASGLEDEIFRLVGIEREQASAHNV